MTIPARTRSTSLEMITTASGTEREHILSHEY